MLPTWSRCVGAAALTLVAGFAAAESAAFNDGWRFTKGDPEGAERVDHDDASWAPLRLPHDWAIAGPVDPDADGSSGKLPWKGVGWYRKTFTPVADDPKSRVYLDFDGVMAFPKVYVNGQLAGEWDYGYTPFRIDVTPHVRLGEENVVAVRVDTTKHGTRWYPGAGIYRDVKLVVTPPVHHTWNGLYVTTPDVTDEYATVELAAEVHNQGDSDAAVEVNFRVLDPSGEEVASQSVGASVASGATATSSMRLRIDDPQRWDIESPNLYRAVAVIRTPGQADHVAETTFGLRTFRFDADEGFFLNGRHVALQGVNQHHDLGPLGAAFSRRAAERQLDILQEMGVNAIRTSHNPPAAELLDLCDRRGILVWDELFDKWDATADRIDGDPPFEEHVARHARTFVRRDRNHPSVVVWSIGNEIVNQPYEPEGKSRERCRFAREEFLKHDATRPVGLGCFIPNSADSDTLSDLDLTGWNYLQRYDNFRQKFPDKPIVYSETASALSSRGAYELPLPQTKIDYPESRQVNAYELSSAPWSDIPEVEFERLRRDKFLAGEFVWTGFDYLGEPTPFAETSRSSYFGIVDLVGLPKDRYYLYRSLWRPDTPTVHLAPHWTWPGHEGQNVPVMVYTNGDSAELFLNGRSLGVRRKGEAPPLPEDLAAGASTSASSEQDGRSAASAHAGDGEAVAKGQGWAAAEGDGSAWIELRLLAPATVRTVALWFPRESKLYGYTIEARTGDGEWRPVATHEATLMPRWGGVNEAYHPCNVESDRFRVRFSKGLEGALPSLDRIALYAGPAESPYFRITYDYRLRWNDVPYEPGELKVVAYRNGAKIGSDVVRTAGEPARLKLSADRQQLSADEDDLFFFTIEAADAADVAHPTADHWVDLSVEGPLAIVGVGNGDPTSNDPFAGDRVRLFNGKAVVVLRPTGEHGQGSMKASAEGLNTAIVALEVPAAPK